MKNAEKRQSDTEKRRYLQDECDQPKRNRETETDQRRYRLNY